MENQKNNKGVIALLIVIIVILSVLCVLFATGTISFNSNKANENEINENANDNNNTENKNETNQNITIDDDFGKNDTFSASSESGIVEIIGYSETKELDGGEVYPGEKEIYVYFHIKEIKSNEFKKYIESLKGNLFALDNAIGLGCVKDNQIKYSNNSDEIGFKQYELSQEDSEKILNSTESNPITLKLERLQLSYGGGAPLCYSHITKIEVK